MTELGLCMAIFFLLCYWFLTESWEISKTYGDFENSRRSIRDFEKARKAVSDGWKK